MPLEDEGLGASMKNHLERSVFGNEIMVASAKKFNSMSRFSLALLEDSGW